MTTVDHDSTTILDLSRPATTEDVIWTLDNLAPLSTTVCICADNAECRRRFGSPPAVQEWHTPDGQLWRMGGVVVVRPQENFRIHLYEGATRKDLAYLNSVIDRAKRGEFAHHGWHEREDGIWAYRWSRPINADDHRGVVLHACHDPACWEEFHDGDDTLHTAEEFARNPHQGVEYAIYVERYETAESPGEWTVNLAVTTFDSGTPEDVATLIDDLRRMQAEADRLNTQATAVAV